MTSIQCGELKKHSNLRAKIRATPDATTTKTANTTIPAIQPPIAALYSESQLGPLQPSLH